MLLHEQAEALAAAPVKALAAAPVKALAAAPVKALAGALAGADCVVTAVVTAVDQILGQPTPDQAGSRW
jgi:hypothetical protein